MSSTVYVLNNELPTIDDFRFDDIKILEMLMQLDEAWHKNLNSCVLGFETTDDLCMNFDLLSRVFLANPEVIILNELDEVCRICSG